MFATRNHRLLPRLDDGRLGSQLTAVRTPYTVDHTQTVRLQCPDGLIARIANGALGSSLK